MLLHGQQHLPDPTQPQSSTQLNSAENKIIDGFPKIEVSAVFINGTRKHAIVNGQTLSEGQQWQGFKLLQVTSLGVVLANQQGPKTFLIDNNINIKKDLENGF